MPIILAITETEPGHYRVTVDTGDDTLDFDIEAHTYVAPRQTTVITRTGEKFYRDLFYTRHHAFARRVLDLVRQLHEVNHPQDAPYAAPTGPRSFGPLTAYEIAERLLAHQDKIVTVGDAAHHVFSLTARTGTDTINLLLSEEARTRQATAEGTIAN